MADFPDAELDERFAPLAAFATLILAVSGGADSVAMMHLVRRWARLNPNRQRRIVVATVDHGLRAGSRKEAEWAADKARALGLVHETLCWEGEKPETGLQDAARNARYRLLAELAWRHPAPAAIVTAHTQDDQAETFLMRLARGSGLDGLTGMSAARLLGADAQCHLVRPLLGVPGARLRNLLEANGVDWIEDPSNAQDRFERVRLRKAHPLLQDIGLDNDKIALSAKRLERAHAALEASARVLEQAAGLDVHGGAYASLDTGVFGESAEELRLRVMARLIAAFGGAAEPVRLVKLEGLIARMGGAGFKGATLGGAAVLVRGAQIQVVREPGRKGLPELRLEPGAAAIWDRRFRVSVAADATGPVLVRALGETGFAHERKRLKDGDLLPARAAATLPAFWRRGTLIAVPGLAGLAGAPAAWGRKDGLCSAEFVW